MLEYLAAFLSSVFRIGTYLFLQVVSLFLPSSFPLFNFRPDTLGDPPQSVTCGLYPPPVYSVHCDAPTACPTKGYSEWGREEEGGRGSCEKRGDNCE